MSENRAIPRCMPQNEWDQVRRESDLTNRKIEKMAPKIDEMFRRTEAVEKIAENVRITTEIQETIKKDLLTAATSKKHVPVAVHLATVVILGSVALMILVEKSQKTIDIPALGIHIGNENQAKPDSK